MAIYLGTNELGGSGGSIPIGGVRYFIPRSGTTFTSGQEVYTDPDDSTVWIRSGAQITSDGAGALDASQYVDAVTSLESTTTQINISARSDRAAFSYDGKNFIGSGYAGGVATVVRLQVRQADGTQIFSSTPATENGGGSRAFFNSTHSFISLDLSGGSVPIYTGSNWAYVQTSTLTTESAYTTALQGATYYQAPAAAQYGCATNIGETGERYWFASVGGTTITEYTFDNTTANGGSPWTATGNTITSALAIDNMTSSGENIVYVLSGTSLLEYNATTRALIRRIDSLGNQHPANGDGGLVVVPTDRSDSGNLEIYTQTTVGLSNTQQSSSTNNTLYSETEKLTAPHGGTFASRTPITLRQAATGTSLSIEELHDGQGDAEESIYLWMRIA